MNILEYVNVLAPVMEKRDLLNSMDAIQTEYEDTLKPITEEIKEAFNGITLKSNLYKKYERQLKITINTNTHPLALMIESIGNLGVVINATKKEIRTNMGIQFTNKSLTFNKANVIKMVDALAFYVKYSRKFILTLVAQEASYLGKATRESWSPAERDYIEKSLNEYVYLIPTMIKSENDLKRDFNSGSNAIVEEETFGIANNSLAISKTDPLNLNNFSPRSNPFVFFGKWSAEYKHTRYLQSKEELYGLQLRLEELRSLKSDDPTNPVIQKQIQDYEKRISEYEYEISKIETKAGI